MPTPNITMRQFIDLFPQIDAKDLIIDVRSEEEYADGHIPGAKHIPYTDIPYQLDELRDAKDIYLYCKMGGRALAAANYLRDLGWTNIVCVHQGGMPNWEQPHHS